MKKTRAVMFEDALIATLTIQQWGGKRVDRQVSNEVDIMKHANDGGRYIKRLLSKHVLKEIGTVVNAARLFHRNYTISLDNASRSSSGVLSSALFFEYSKKIDEFRTKFYEEVDKVSVDFPQIVKQEAQRLGDLFDENDFAVEFEESFYFKVSYMPLSSNYSFDKVVFGDESKKMLDEMYEKEMEQVSKKIVSGSLSKLLDSIEYLVGRLDGDKIFRDKLIDNVRQTIEIVERMNITNNRIVTAQCKKARKALAKATADSLRQDDNAKVKTVKTLKSVVDKINSCGLL